MQHLKGLIRAGTGLKFKTVSDDDHPTTCRPLSGTWRTCTKIFNYRRESKLIMTAVSWVCQSEDQSQKLGSQWQAVENEADRLDGMDGFQRWGERQWPRWIEMMKWVKQTKSDNCSTGRCVDPNRGVGSSLRLPPKNLGKVNEFYITALVHFSNPATYVSGLLNRLSRWPLSINNINVIHKSRNIWTVMVILGYHPLLGSTSPSIF